MSPFWSLGPPLLRTPRKFAFLSPLTTPMPRKVLATSVFKNYVQMFQRICRAVNGIFKTKGRRQTKSKFSKFMAVSVLSCRCEVWTITNKQEVEYRNEASPADSEINAFTPTHVLLATSAFSSTVLLFYAVPEDSSSWFVSLSPSNPFLGICTIQLQFVAFICKSAGFVLARFRSS